MVDPSTSPDYTKTKCYAYLDLACKVISAVALVALGAAGWMLQRGSEQSKIASQVYEAEERKYLPMLRSLIDMEIELQDVALELRAREPQTERLLEISNEMRFASASLFQPDGDEAIIFSSYRNISEFAKAGIPTQDSIGLHLQATAFMCSDLLTTRALVDQPPTMNRGTIRLDVPHLILVGHYGDSLVFEQYLSQESLPAWQSWLGDAELSLSSLDTLVLVRLVIALRSAVSSVIQKVLRDHHDLGDRYVQMRDEVEKNHRSNVGTRDSSVRGK